VTDETLHEIAMAAKSTNMKPYSMIAAVDRMVDSGRAEFIGPYEWRLTQKGLDWLGGIQA
jgi:hypothetical protein